MSEILQPCPFCGGAKICTEKSINLNYCDNCSAESNIEHWNTRPIEDALQARIAELEAENEKINYFFRKLRMFCIFAHWDNPNTEAEFYKVDAEIREYLSEYKVCIDQLTAQWRQERQDDKWIPVSERLPETYKPVLTVDMSEATQIPVPAFYNPDTKCWSTHFEYDLWVTHWMPLPESPNDTQKETFVYGKERER